MAQGFWVPDPADDGLAPSGVTFSIPWHAVTSVLVQDVGGGEAQLVITYPGGSSDRRGVMFTEIAGFDTSALTDVELYVEYTINGSAHDFYAVARMGGGDTSEEAVWARRRRQVTSGESMGTYDAGTSSILASGSAPTTTFVRRKIRLRANGTSLQARFWDSADPEPGTWTLDTTNSDVSGAGGIGVSRFENSNASFPTNYIHAIGWGTGGDSAPTEPVAGGETASAAVDASANVGMSAIVTSFASMAAASTHSGSVSSQAATLSDFTAGAQHNLTVQGMAAAQGAISVPVQAGATLTARADFSASITATGSHGQTIAGQSAAIVSISADAQAGQTMTGQVDAGGDVSADMVVSATVSATASAQAQALAAMLAGVEGGTTISGSKSIDASMILSSSAGVGMTASITISAGMDVGAQASVVSSAQAQAQADIQVSVQAATELIARAATLAGLSAGHIHNIVITASSISGDFTTPDERTFTVELDLRSFTVDEESRLFIVSAEDRTYTVH